MRTKSLLIALLLPVATFAASITQTQLLDVSCLLDVYGSLHLAACQPSFQSFDSTLGTLQSVTLMAEIDVHSDSHQPNPFSATVAWDPFLTLNLELHLGATEMDYGVTIKGATQMLVPGQMGRFSADFDFSHTFQFASVTPFIGQGIVPELQLRDVVWSATSYGGASFTGTNNVVLTYNYAPNAGFAAVQAVPDGGSTVALLAIAIGCLAAGRNTRRLVRFLGITSG